MPDELSQYRVQQDHILDDLSKYRRTEQPGDTPENPIQEMYPDVTMHDRQIAKTQAPDVVIDYFKKQRGMSDVLPVSSSFLGGTNWVMRKKGDAWRVLDPSGWQGFGELGKDIRDWRPDVQIALAGGLGAVKGAAIGTAGEPGVGTIIGAGIGMGAGSAAGRAALLAEAKLSGFDPSLKQALSDIAIEGALGTGFGAGGEAARQLGGKYLAPKVREFVQRFKKKPEASTEEIEALFKDLNKAKKTGDFEAAKSIQDKLDNLSPGEVEGIVETPPSMSSARVKPIIGSEPKPEAMQAPKAEPAITEAPLYGTKEFQLADTEKERLSKLGDEGIAELRKTTNLARLGSTKEANIPDDIKRIIVKNPIATYAYATAKASSEPENKLWPTLVRYMDREWRPFTQTYRMKLPELGRLHEARRIALKAGDTQEAEALAEEMRAITSLEPEDIQRQTGLKTAKEAPIEEGGILPEDVPSNAPPEASGIPIKRTGAQQSREEARAKGQAFAVDEAEKLRKINLDKGIANSTTPGDADTVFAELKKTQDYAPLDNIEVQFARRTQGQAAVGEEPGALRRMMITWKPAKFDTLQQAINAFSNPNQATELYLNYILEGNGISTAGLTKGQKIVKYWESQPGLVKGVGLRYIPGKYQLLGPITEVNPQGEILGWHVIPADSMVSLKSSFHGQPLYFAPAKGPRIASEASSRPGQTKGAVEDLLGTATPSGRVFRDITEESARAKGPKTLNAMAEERTKKELIAKIKEIMPDLSDDAARKVFETGLILAGNDAAQAGFWGGFRNRLGKRLETLLPRRTGTLGVLLGLGAGSPGILEAGMLSGAMRSVGKGLQGTSTIQPLYNLIGSGSMALKNRAQAIIGRLDLNNPVHRATAAFLLLQDPLMQEHLKAMKAAQNQ